MPYRHALSDAHWERIKDLLPGREGDPGVTAKDNRLFVALRQVELGVAAVHPLGG